MASFLAPAWGGSQVSGQSLQTDGRFLGETEGAVAGLADQTTDAFGAAMRAGAVGVVVVDGQGDTAVQESPGYLLILQQVPGTTGHLTGWIPQESQYHRRRDVVHLELAMHGPKHVETVGTQTPLVLASVFFPVDGTGDCGSPTVSRREILLLATFHRAVAREPIPEVVAAIWSRALRVLADSDGRMALITTAVGLVLASVPAAWAAA